MSGINDGQRVNAANSNAAWLSKNGDDTTVGKVGLNNPDTVSGTSVTNLQREQNAIWSFVGGLINQVKTYLPTWSNNNGFTSTDSVKDRVDTISGKFNATSGHAHTGAAGDAPAISSSSLANVVLRGFQVRGVDIASPSGSSINVSTQMTGKTVSSGQTVKGVVVSSPYNEVVIKRLTGSESDSYLEDSNGNVVFGRLTHAAGVWTLSFFTDVSGTETAYTMTAVDTSAGIKWWYIELFNPITDAPVYPEHIFIPSDNYTQDILDASITQRGLVSTGAQTFEGEKTLEKALVPKILGSAPANPPANYFKLYPKSDGFYSLNSSGVEQKIGPNATVTPPTVQRFTSGSGTYTKPANVSYIIVEMVGGGGGGGGSGTTSGTAAGAGGNTTFGTSLLTATGGSAGARGAVGASGGGTTINSPAVTLIATTGGSGGGGSVHGSAISTASPYVTGGHGGVSGIGGAGGNGSQAGSAGLNASANSGSGGGGAGLPAVNSGQSGNGGGAGGYVKALITSPSATYAYAVGGGGAGQAAGTSGAAGGNGGSGLIVVTEYY